MALQVLICCDGFDCSNEKHIDSDWHETVESEVDGLALKGKWLIDDANHSYYCPSCAPEASAELGLEYKV